MKQPYDPRKHHRRSIRLRGYDYAAPCAYFVTVCVQGRECLLGAVVDGEMVPNPAGWMVQRVWDELPGHYPGVETDTFAALPNHVHGIVVLTGPGHGLGHGQAQGPAPTAPGIVGATPRGCPDPHGCPPSLSLPDVVHRFKSYKMAQYRNGVNQHGWPRFLGRLWQRNYWEHIIRDDAAEPHSRIHRHECAEMIA
jgi:putative transposase